MDLYTYKSIIQNYIKTYIYISNIDLYNNINQYLIKCTDLYIYITQYYKITSRLMYISIIDLYIYNSIFQNYMQTCIYINY